MVEEAGYQPPVDDGYPDDEPSVPLPLSFYAVLGLPAARAHAGAIEASVDSALDREIVNGYSDECLLSRMDLIQAAGAVLSNEEAKREHDHDLREGRLTPIPIDQVTGALCLLQEAGEHEAVIEFSQDCMDAVQGRAARRDVALTVALAYCEVGHIAMTSTPPRVGEGCELLELANGLLRGEGGRNFAPELQDTVERTLQEMAPAYVLELLALPLENERERKEGLRALRTLLWSKGAAAMQSRSQFVQEANRYLTSTEAAELFVDAPDHVPAEPAEVYHSALAHIVAGVVYRRPMLIVDADEILAQLELAQTAGSVGEAQFGEMAVERGVAQLLLGRVEDAADTLGLGPGAAKPPEPSVERFVADHSPNGDAMEGMCALAERWILDVAFPTFRDAAEGRAPPPSLDAWFEEPHVQAFIERFETSPRLVRVAAAADAATRAASGIADAVTAAIRPGGGLRGLAAGLRQGGGGAGAFPAGMPDMPPTVALGGALLVGGAMIVTGLPRQTTTPPQAAPSAAATAPSAPPGPKASKPSFADAGALVGAALSDAGEAAAGALGNLPGFRKPAPAVDAAVAEKVVRRWQSAKAQALGVAHNLRPLDSILEGPMLAQWRTRAEDVKAHGWAWEYQLNALTIDKVESLSADRVVVEATLTEVAILKDRARTEEDDKYESTYRARYELRRGDGKGSGGGVRAWKIVGGSVVY